MAITRRQKEVIDFLSNFTQKNGYSPSYEEIASGLGLSSLATVHKHITNLQNKGLLQRAHNRSRSIDVLPVRSGKKGSDRLPLLGRIAAGKPVEAIETAESISLSEILSAVSMASTGLPAAMRPRSGRRSEPFLPERTGSTSMERLRLCARCSRPLFWRLVMCLCTVASEFRPSPDAISS